MIYVVIGEHQVGMGQPDFFARALSFKEFFAPLFCELPSAVE
jgi:hypothetical protein